MSSQYKYQIVFFLTEFRVTICFPFDNGSVLGTKWNVTIFVAPWKQLLQMKKKQKKK